MKVFWRLGGQKGSAFARTEGSRNWSGAKKRENHLGVATPPSGDSEEVPFTSSRLAHKEKEIRRFGEALGPRTWSDK